MYRQIGAASSSYIRIGARGSVRDDAAADGDLVEGAIEEPAAAALAGDRTDGVVVSGNRHPRRELSRRLWRKRDAVLFTTC